MKLPGYDKWRRAGPPEWEGQTCDWCFTGQDDGPCFDDLQTATDHAQEQAEDSRRLPARPGAGSGGRR